MTSISDNENHIENNQEYQLPSNFEEVKENVLEQNLLPIVKNLKKEANLKYLPVTEDTTMWSWILFSPPTKGTVWNNYGQFFSKSSWRKRLKIKNINSLLISQK